MHVCTHVSEKRKERMKELGEGGRREGGGREGGNKGGREGGGRDQISLLAK